jgi:hypothetical protein
MKKLAIVFSVMMAVIFTAVTVSAQSVTTTQKPKTEKAQVTKDSKQCAKTCDKSAATECSKTCAKKDGTMAKGCCAKGQAKSDDKPTPKAK